MTDTYIFDFDRPVIRTTNLREIRFSLHTQVRPRMSALDEIAPGITGHRQPDPEPRIVEVIVNACFAGELGLQTQSGGPFRIYTKPAHRPYAAGADIHMHRAGSDVVTPEPAFDVEAADEAIRMAILTGLDRAWSSVPACQMLIVGEATPEGIDALREGTILWDEIWIHELDPALTLPPVLPLEVHLAPASRRHTGPSGSTAAVSPGRVVMLPVEPSQEGEARTYHEFWVAASSALNPEPGRMTIASTETWEVPCSRLAALRSALDSYHLPFDSTMSLALDGDEGSLRAQLHLSIPAETASAWLQSPADNEATYFQVFSQVMAAVQTVVRRRAPLRYFLEGGSYGEPNSAWAMLAYRCSRPFRGRNRVDLLYDPTFPDRLLNPRRLSPSDLEQEFSEVAGMLRLEGDTDLADTYARARPDRVVDYLRRFRRKLNRLVFSEGELVRGILAFGSAVAAVRTARDRTSASHQLLRALDRLVGAINQRCRSLFENLHCPELGAVLLLETTRALNRALRLPCPLHATLFLKRDGQTWILTSTSGPDSIAESRLAS